MRIVQATRWPVVPWWAVGVVIAWLALVGTYTLVATMSEAGAPILCAFRRITDHPCPSCGGTRMAMALLRGDFAQAAGHNPLLFVGVLLMVCALVFQVTFRRRIVLSSTPKGRRFAALSLIAAVAGNWVYLLAST